MMLSLGRIHRLKCMHLPIVKGTSYLSTLTHVVVPVSLSRYHHHHYHHHQYHHQYIDNVRHSSSLSTPITIEVKTKRARKKKVRKALALKAINTNTSTSNTSNTTINDTNTILNKKHLLLNKDINHIYIKNSDDLITFATNQMTKSELLDLTSIIHDIDSGSDFNKSFVYKNSLKNDDMYIYRAVVDALVATLSGTPLLPLTIPTTVMMTTNRRLTSALLDSIRKESDEATESKAMQEEVEALASNIVSLIPLTLSNEIIDDLNSYTTSTITKELLSSQLWFKYINPKSRETNIHYAVASISSLLAMKYKKIKNVKELNDTIDMFTVAVNSYINTTDIIKRCSVNNIKELQEVLSNTMDTNSMKALVMDLQAIRKVNGAERSALIQKLVARKTSSPSSSLHDAILNSIQGRNITFPIYFRLTRSDDDGDDVKELPKSIARVLLHMKRKQAKNNYDTDTKEEETLG